MALRAVIAAVVLVALATVPAADAKKKPTCKFGKEQKGCPIKSGGYATKPGQSPILELVMVLTPESRATVVVHPEGGACAAANPPVQVFRYIGRTKTRVTMGGTLKITGTETVERDGVTATVTVKGAAKLVNGKKATTKGTAHITYSNGAPPCDDEWSGSMRRV